MGKVKKHHVFISLPNAMFDDNNAPKISVDIDLMVNAKSAFYARLDNEFIEPLKNIGIILNDHPSRPDKHGKAYIVTKTLQELESKINSTLKNLIEFEVIEEKTVIRYSFGYYAHFTVNNEGVIKPNGIRKGEYDWFEPNIKNNMNSDSYNLSIGVSILNKKRVVFPNGTEKTVYERHQNTLRPDTISEDSREYYINDLVNLVRIKPTGQIQEIDATYQNVKAFHQLVFGMLSLIKNIAQLNDQENLLKLIETNGNLLGDGNKIK